MFHAQTSRSFRCHPARLPTKSTKRTADFHSQVSHLSRRACKCTVDFHSQVISPLKTCLQVHCWLSLTSQLTSQDVLASAPLTFTLKSVTSVDMLASAPLTFTPKSVTSHDMLASAPSTFTHKSLLTSPIREARHCGMVLFSWRRHLALVPDTAVTYYEFCAKNAHCGLRFACGAVFAEILQHVLWDWVTLYTFLSYLWRKFLLEPARPCYKVPT